MIKARNSLNINCFNCKNNSVCLPRGLEKEEIEKLNNIITRVYCFEKGKHIFRRNDSLHNLLAVYSGVTKDYWIDIDGNEHIDNFYFTGDIIGLESIPRRKHVFSGIAVTDVQLCVVPIQALYEIMVGSRSLLDRMMNIASYKMQNDAQIFFTTNVKQRVANFILNILFRLQERELFKPNEAIYLPMSQFDIANFLGIAYETLSRVLHEFHHKKILHIEGRSIYVLDLKRLKYLGKVVEEFGQA